MTKACLCLHGFTGGPFEVKPLADYLSRAGWTCSTPTLPGHEHPSQLGLVSRHDWVEAAEAWAADMADRHGPFDLVGFSMGGLLAAHVANRYPVRRLVLLNAAVLYVSPGRFAKSVVSAVRSKEWGRFRSIKATPLRATWQFMQLARQIKPEWERIRVPTLIVQSGRDEVVHPLSERYLSAKIAAPTEIVRLPASRHRVCLDEEAERLFEAVRRFLLGE